MMFNPYTISNIDLTKYKRFFVFGCSFTNYRWPTWADLVAREMPNVQYYNFGGSGGGHQYISTTLNQAIRYYNIKAETDLVAIMWSTFYREDRLYFTGLDFEQPMWSTPGNIFTQHDVPVLKYHDPLGMAVSALSTIDTITTVLNVSKFDSFSMWSMHPDSQLDMYNSDKTSLYSVSNKITGFYRNLDGKVLPDMYVSSFNRSWPAQFPKEYIPSIDKEVNDYHPTTEAYFNYLSMLGLPLSPGAKDFSIESDIKTKELKESFANGKIPFMHNDVENLLKVFK